MKLSELSDNLTEKLSAAQKIEIVFGNDKDFSVQERTDATILLGGPSDVMPERAKSAANLYKNGKTDLIVPSGGIIPPNETKCEAMILRDLLLSYGVPDEKILPETTATTTHENMICSYLLLMRHIGLFGINRISIVTSRYHLRRSLALAKNYLPKHCSVCGYSDDAAPTDINSDLSALRINFEIKFDRELILNNMMDDIEI